MKNIAVAAFMLASLPCAAHAQEWEILSGMTSAKLAAVGWQQAGVAGLSFPNGRQAIITFWSMDNLTMRCVDYFGTDMVPSGSTCSQAITK